MELHPLCTLFPRLEGKEFDGLVEDIRANGLRNPIIVYDGMILDGGNRERACREAGVIAEYEEFMGADPAAFVLSVNLHRRHMTLGQQAAAVAAAQDWTMAQARGGDRTHSKGQRLPFDLGETKHEESNSNGEQLAKRSTPAERAAKSGASVRTQKMADKVARSDPKLAAQVARGEVTMKHAIAQVSGAAEKEADRQAMEEALGDVDPVAEWAKAEKELEEAQKLIEVLSQDDLKAEVKRLTDVCKGVERRLSDEMTRCGALDKELRVYGKWLKELREITGAQTRPDITRVVRDAVRIAKDTVEL